MSIKEILKKNKAILKCHAFVKKSYYSLLTMISPKLNASARYRSVYKRKINWNDPQTFSEKLLWLIINRYIKDPLVIKCADKYRVREYVTECGCQDILVDLYKAYNSPDQIVWGELPDSFAMKWNFGAGMNIICRDKSELDEKQIIKQMKRWGKIKCWLSHAELQYKYAPKKILCERFLDDGLGGYPRDFKVYCFNGQAKFLMLCIGREKGHPKFYFFDKDWNLCRLNRDSIEAPEDLSVPKPEGVDKVFEYAEILSAPFPFVRADFYVIGDKVYFGELTFTPSGGIDSARLPETDAYFGSLLDLNNIMEV